MTASHADRPEFQDALAKGSGEAIRPSDTTRTTMLYEARRFTDGNIGRVSMPISSVNALVLQGVAGFLAAAAVALVLTLLLARKLAVSTAQPLELKQEELDQEGRSSRPSARSLPPMSLMSSRPPDQYQGLYRHALLRHGEGPGGPEAVHHQGSAWRWTGWWS